MTYLEVEAFLADNNLSKDEMDKIWQESSESNWKVQKLIEYGKHWSDINRIALETLPGVKRKGADE